MKHKYPASFPLLCIVFLHITFLACERRELTYYEVAEISLSADWSLSGLDSKEADFGATALFYPQTGGEPKVFLLGDRSGDKAYTMSFSLIVPSTTSATLHSVEKRVMKHWKPVPAK